MADFSPFGCIVSDSRYKQVDFTVIWLFQSLEIVVPFPNEENDNHLSTFIQPFQLMVGLHSFSNHFKYLFAHTKSLWKMDTML